MISNKVQHLRNNPDIRFHNFTKDYSYYKLGELVSRVTRKNKEQNNNNLTISAQFGLVSQREFFNRDIASKDNSHYYLLENGEFAYNKSYSKGYPVGVVRRLDRYERGVVSTLYICFKPHSLINSEYLLQFFESGKLNRRLLSIAQEGARNHGLLNISVHDFFSDINLTIPLIGEQKKVAEFHRVVDNKILLLGEKLENLKLFRKGLIQREFSKPSSEVILGKLISEYSERNKQLQVKRVLSVTNSRGFITQDEMFDRSVASSDISTYKIVKKGQFGYNPSRINVGSIDLLTKYEDGVLSPIYVIFNCNKSKLNSHYLKYWFDSHSFKGNMKKYIEGGVRDTLSFKNLSSMRIPLPSIEEQNKFNNRMVPISLKTEVLDNYIKTLKQFKKGLLQKMFI